EGSGLMLGPFGPGHRVRDGHEWVGGRVLAGHCVVSSCWGIGGQEGKGSILPSTGKGEDLLQGPQNRASGSFSSSTSRMGRALSQGQGDGEQQTEDHL